MEKQQQIIGYARVSTPTQKLSRQIDNLKKAYPDIVIIQETYSGKTQNRPKWQKLLRQCRAGNVSKLVFDEVSRFSRNAEEAIKEYKELYELGIELEFIKEPHINSEVYRQASQRQINVDTSAMDADTAHLLNTVIEGLNDYLLAVAEKQIRLAFERAQAERELLSKRTSEGLKQAKLMGSKVGRQKGERLETRKKKRAVKIIRQHYKLLGGELTATQCFLLCQVTKSTFYRYINEMREEDKTKGIIWADEKIIINDKDCCIDDVIDIFKNKKEGEY
jgi:DNA invertase Pin-like site-specific DNA recombinase